MRPLVSLHLEIKGSETHSNEKIRLRSDNAYGDEYLRTYWINLGPVRCA